MDVGGSATNYAVLELRVPIITRDVLANFDLINQATYLPPLMSPRGFQQVVNFCTKAL